MCSSEFKNTSSPAQFFVICDSAHASGQVNPSLGSSAEFRTCCLPLSSFQTCCCRSSPTWLNCWQAETDAVGAFCSVRSGPLPRREYLLKANMHVWTRDGIDEQGRGCQKWQVVERTFAVGFLRRRSVPGWPIQPSSAAFACLARGGTLCNPVRARANPRPHLSFFTQHHLYHHLLETISYLCPLSPCPAVTRSALNTPLLRLSTQRYCLAVLSILLTPASSMSLSLVS